MHFVSLSRHSVDEVVVDAIGECNLIIGLGDHFERLLVLLFACKGQPND